MSRRGHVRRGLHAALAVLFGFMSLWHGPLMACASTVHPVAVSEHAHPPSHDSAHHHTHAADVQSGTEPASESPPSALPGCYGTGCFLAVNVLPQPVAAALLVPLGRISPQAAPALTGAILDPPVPPPRALLQSH